jgi:hypothetical protein
MTELATVQTRKQILNVVNLSREIWIERYLPIVGRAQVNYRTEKTPGEHPAPDGS